MNRLTIREAYDKWADELVAYATVVAGRDDAADAVADTFASLLRTERAAATSNTPTPWEQVREPRAYLYRSVLNTARRRHRARSRRSARETRHDRLERPVRSWSPVPADSPLHDPDVMRAVDALSLGQRSAIYLTYWDDLSVYDVARAMGCSTGSVKRHLARARAALREALDGKDLP